ncbi:MAG TPA: hypothetical protein VFY68_18980 [Nitrososphaeraceae archaeon]|nr:hypothetical protein [Nitrososphaeraceae archaeon]
MKRSPLTFSAILAAVLISSMIYPVYANQMTVTLVTESDKAHATFTAIRFITIQYPPGSELAKQFDGKRDRVIFTENNTAGNLNQVISNINQVLRTEKQSPVQIENATLDYTASIRGEADRVALAYKVVLESNISRFVLEQGGEQGTVLDLDWRGIVIEEPLIVDTQEYGQINVNYPIGLLEATYPQFAANLLNSPEAAAIMNDPLFTFEEIGAPMERWHFLFDPTGSQAGAAGAGYIEEGGAKVVSIFSLGESSFREGTHAATEKSAEATINGTQVSIQSSTPPPSGQIQITGFARVAAAGGGELAFVTSQAPAGTTTATGGFPIQVLLVLGGMMGAVAVFVLLKARK